MRTVLADISRLLEPLGSPGSFAARRTAPARDLHLTVKGVGPVRLPREPRHRPQADPDRTSSPPRIQGSNPPRPAGARHLGGPREPDLHRFCISGRRRVLAVLTVLLWNRGALTPLWRRIRALPRRTSRAAWGLMAALLVGFAATGGFIFYNTHILNPYLTGVAGEQVAVDYERRYRSYEGVLQPRITGVSIAVDIYPRQRRYETRGSYVLENKGQAPIARVLVGYQPGGAARALQLQGAVLESRDDRLGETVWRLSTPMQPQERRTLTFTIDHAPR